MLEPKPNVLASKQSLKSKENIYHGNTEYKRRSGSPRDAD